MTPAGCPRRIVAAAAVTCFLAAASAAEDRVTVRPENSAGLLTIVGDVEEYTDESLTIRIRGGVPYQSFSTEDVEAVEAYRSRAHQAGIEQFEAGQVAEAAVEFQSALQKETRGWVRRDILAWLVRCHERLGQQEAAIERFVEIVVDEPHTRHWNVAPLVWSAESISPGAQASAHRWLLHKSDAVRLVGASLLLTDLNAGGAAQVEMKSLARSSDRYLGNLARAQRWRLALQTETPSAIDLDRWRRDIERMPETVRAGPWYLLGAARLRLSSVEEAAAAFLRVLIVHSQNEELAARCGLEAALALDRLNRQDEAAVLYREVDDRFAWTSFAREARSKLAVPDPPQPAP